MNNRQLLSNTERMRTELDRVVQVIVIVIIVSIVSLLNFQERNLLRAKLQEYMRHHAECTAGRREPVDPASMCLTGGRREEGSAGENLNKFLEQDSVEHKPTFNVNVQGHNFQREARGATRGRPPLLSSTRPACPPKPAPLAALAASEALEALEASGSTTFQLSDNRRARGEGSTRALVP